MPVLFAVFTSTVPLLVAAVLSFAAVLTSFSYQYRRNADHRLLVSYRVTLVISALQLLVYVAYFNHWGGTTVSNTVLARLVIGSLAFYPSLVLMFRYGFQRNPGSRGPVEAAAFLFGTMMTLWMQLDAQNLIRNASTTPQGYARFENGLAFAWFVMLLASATCACLALVYSQAKGGSRAQARRFTVTGLVLVAAVGLDLSVASLGLNLPPLVWLATIMLIYGFLRDSTENYSAAVRAWRRIAEEHMELKQKVIRDPLTGLYTRTYGIEALEKALKDGIASVVFVDLDHFKSWNDRFGHAAGDRVLTEVANAIRVSARVGDICARYAGDEFFVILQDTKLTQAVQIAQAIADELRRIQLKAGLTVTGSIGVTLAAQRENADRAMNRADQLAYQAKRGGKNRIVSDTSTVTSSATEVRTSSAV
jgi:diguanylate cyclase (GGDEF)-like protein